MKNSNLPQKKGTISWCGGQSYMFVLCLLWIGLLPASAVTRQWTNTLGGSWFTPSNWSPNGVPSGSDIANITTSGTYTVSILTNAVTVATVNLGGSSGTQTILNGTVNNLNVTNAATVLANGVVVVTNGGLQGKMTIQAGGQLQLSGSATKNVYSLVLVNQGTVTWSGGFLNGGSTPPTAINNSGLWQITGDNQIYQAYSGPPLTWTNSGTVRKNGGSGTSYIQNFNFYNQAGGVIDTLSGTLLFNGGTENVLGGSLTATSPGTLSLNAGTWTDAGGVASGSGTNQFSGGVLNLRTNIIPGLRLTGGNVYVTGTTTFQQAGAITNLTLDGAQLSGTNFIGSGLVTVNSGGLDGKTTVLPAGQLALATGATKNVYSLVLVNQGTVTWSGGFLNGGSTPPTAINNSGLWQITGDNQIYQAYSGPPLTWTNSGTVRKNGGSGTSYIQNFNFYNQAGGVIDTLSGTLLFNGGTENVLGGSLTATSPGTLSLNAGTWTDAGGVASGSGTNQFSGGVLNLRTNIIPGLRLTGGNVYVTGTTTFQQAGAITNLTLDGAQLSGTNFIGSGLVTVNSGGLDGKTTVLPAGQLALATGATKNVYSLVLVNQGTVTWSGGFLNGGSTPPTAINNSGLWQITGDNQIYQAYSGPPLTWTNSGTVRKNGGSGTSYIQNFNFYNQPTGVIQVDTGTLQLPSSFTNTSGILRLSGGTLTASGTLGLNGGTLEGNGTVGANALIGGSITPGQTGPGILQFSSDLNLGANATVILSGIGTAPGTQYDQLSVTGAVSLANATLQVTSLPTVPGGTTFFIILNDGVDAVSGTFNGLAENSIINVSGQAFQIHYAGGTGNDVTLVRDGAAPAGAQLMSLGGITNGVLHFTGSGVPSGVYGIQATTNFIQWTNLGSATGDLSGKFNFADSNAFRFNYRFYRTTN